MLERSVKCFLHLTFLEYRFQHFKMYIIFDFKNYFGSQSQLENDPDPLPNSSLRPVACVKFQYNV